MAPEFLPVHEPDFMPIVMPDADIAMLYPCDLPMEPFALLEELKASIPWRQDPVRLFGRTYQQPRLTAWFGDPGMDYSYSGLRLSPEPWTDLLSDIKRQVEQSTGGGFNSVLLNLYRDHRDSMGMHADDEKELGPEPMIASLSLGASRTLVMKHRYDSTIPRQSIVLPSGSLLLMKGATQHFWKHGIMKQTRPCGSRLNLTFRTIFRG